MAKVVRNSYCLNRQNDIPTVESVSSSRGKQVSHEGCMRLMELAPGDEIIAVDGKAVATTKQCIKNFRNSSSMKVVWRVRRRHPHASTVDASENHNGSENGSNTDGKKGTKLTTDSDNAEPGHSRQSSAEGAEVGKSIPEAPRSFAFRSSVHLPGCNESLQQIFRTSDFPSTKVRQKLSSELLRSWVQVLKSLVSVGSAFWGIIHSWCRRVTQVRECNDLELCSTKNSSRD